MHRAFFAAICWVASSGVVSAGCDLSAFDRGTPTAFRAGVDNVFAQFDWASDADQWNDGRIRIWHYIKNNGTRSLGVNWQKAGIRVPLLRPLPAGGIYCKLSFVDRVAERPDRDAPIIYGTNEQREEAVVFVSDEPPKTSVGSRIDTTYQDENGATVPIQIGVSSGATKDGVFLMVDSNSHEFEVGFTKLAGAFSPAELAKTVAMGQKAVVTTFGAYTKQIPAKTLGDVLSASELASFEKEDLLLLSGPGKKYFQISSSAATKLKAEMVVFDKNRTPITITDVTLFVPTK